MSTRNDLFAIDASRRVNPKAVGLGGPFIQTILAAIIPILLEQLTNCFSPKAQKTLTTDAMRAKLEAAYRKDPKSVLDQAAKEAMKEARRQGKKITKSQALAIADAAIDEALMTPEIDWSL